MGRGTSSRWNRSKASRTLARRISTRRDGAVIGESVVAL